MDRTTPTATCSSTDRGPVDGRRRRPDVAWDRAVDRVERRRAAAGRPRRAQARRERFVRRTVDWLVVAALRAVRVRAPAPRPDPREHHARRRRHGRPRVGPRLPARPPAARSGRLTGWTPDWYAGFPAYQFYMVVPSLLIVALDVGRVRRLADGHPARRRRRPRRARQHAGSRAGAAGRWSRRRCVVVVLRRRAALRHRVQAGHGRRRAVACRCAPTPSAGWPTCRSPARRCSPWPRVLVPLRPQLHDLRRQHRRRRWPASSPSRSACRSALLYLGVVSGACAPASTARSAAVLLALTGLCHLIPAFFALAGTVVIALLRRPALAHAGRGSRRRCPSPGLLSAFWVAAVLLAARLRQRHGLGEAPVRDRRERFRSLRHAVHLDGETFWKYLIPRRRRPAQRPALGPRPGRRRRRAVDRVPGPGRARSWPAARLSWPVAFVLPPRGPALERPPAALLLPVPLPAGRRRRGRGGPHDRRAGRAATRSARASSARSSTAASAPLAALRARRRCRCGRCPSAATDGPTAATRWLRPRRTASTSRASSRSWARWNYTGYEGKAAYPEYRDLVHTMERGRRGARLRAGVLGVREGAQPLRHADGADAAAVLDRRLHRLDGGPVLRGVGHHAVPLPQPGRAVARRRAPPSATCPTAASTSTRASSTCS